tara:strand:+ start:115 stop:456 length:342 start_codon:yes stop_codon:yes gene_type:complete
MTNNTTTLAQKLYKMSDEELKKRVVGRVVYYKNQGPSSVKVDGNRRFSILGVEEIAFSKKDNIRYMKVDERDLDNNLERDFKNLQIGGITKIEHPAVTAIKALKEAVKSQSRR